MYIIIVGAGEVGRYLAQILVDEHHDVAIVEADAELAAALDARLDALVVHGSGVNSRTLRRAGIAKADLVLAVTQVDEVNLIACMTAAKFGGTCRTVARVREDQYLLGEASLSAAELGLSMLVGPERAVAGEVVGLLSYEGAGEVHYLADGKIALLELPLAADSPLVHETLAELNEIFPVPSLVVAISGPSGLRIPRGGDRMAPDERAFVLTDPGNASEWWILSGKPWHRVSHVLIVGCGDIGFHLARELEKQQIYPTIIEVDRARAEWVSRRLSKSIVLHGDGTDLELLQEQLDERSDAVVVLLEDDEKAVLVSIFAKQMGAKKVIARSDKPGYAHIAHKLGVDALISPRRAVADEILRFVRKGKVAAAHMLGDHDAEIVDIVIPEKPNNPDLLGVALEDLEFPDGAILGAVVRGDKVSIATGKTALRAGDEVLVVSLTSAIHAVEKLLT